ncbi:MULTISPECIES: restriction endonuclease subunit S [Stutzerimonas]|uniref:Restriction endonuclease subunit S n=1 Tax=Stutzerimonas kunmingensis TaxID=1211807 RepID=A0A9X1SQQ2_9GAMM|nr:MULTISPECIES: restriction endonuclease subunit S [Stutzerimonas]MCD1609834.1 restriction endonuclease subunit S [Stutzerimonas kunmingensis]PNF99108.1 restriction endonuclease subunit S [Stutzerimonas kunmingensis]
MSHYKPYPAYKDSGVEWLGRVPEHWSVVRMRYAATLNPPVRRDLLEDPDQEVSFLPMEAIGEDGSLNLEQNRPVVEVRSGYSYFEDGDVAFAKVTPCFENGKGALMRGLRCAAGFGTTELTVLRPNLAVADARYINYIVQGSSFRAFGAGAMTGAGGLKRVPDEFTRNFPVSLPELGEQRVIASRLDRETARIDALIEKKTRFIELLREKRQALITHAVTKGLDPNVKMKDSGVEWLGEVPEHWEVLQLRHTARLESGHTPSRSKPEYWVDCNVPWFTLADVWQVRSGEQKYVSETSEMVSQLGLENSSARLLPAGSVFLSRTASVGFTGIMAVDMATSQDFAVWTCTSELFNEYLYYVLLGMKPDFDRLMMGSTHKTIYMPDIEAIRIARPPVDEQRGIVSVLSGQLGRFKSVIEKTERSIELLTERRSTLITAAVTGQIDLREAV